MGQCPCWGGRKKSSYNPFIYDEDYLEYGSSDSESSFNTYRPPVPVSQQTSVNRNSNPSPLSSSPYSSSPVHTSPSQSDSRPSSTSYPPETSQQPQQEPQPTTQQPQFTQYTESVFLSRPNQPTDSMMLDSMMDSTILGIPRVADSGMLDSSMMANNSGVEASVYFDASSNSFITNSVQVGAFEPTSSPQLQPQQPSSTEQQHQQQ